MGKKTEPTVNEFSCPGCKEKLLLGTKKCKWCGTYIANPPEKVEDLPIEQPKKKKFWLKK